MRAPEAVSKLALEMVMEAMNSCPELEGTPRGIEPENIEQVDERMISFNFKFSIRNNGETATYQAMANMTAEAEPKAIYLFIKVGPEKAYSIEFVDRLGAPTWQPPEPATPPIPRWVM